MSVKMQDFLNRLTRRGQVHQAEEQTSFWAKDSEFKACYGCDAEFTFFLRKHHCRMCGGIHCDKCSSNYLPPHAFEHISVATHQRCCNRCAGNYEAANGLPQGTFSTSGAHRTAASASASASVRPPDSNRPSRPPKPVEASTDRPPRAKMARTNSSRSIQGQQNRIARGEVSGLSISRGPSLSSQQLPDPSGTTVQSSVAPKTQSEAGSKAKTTEASSSKDPALIWEEPAQMPVDYGAYSLSEHPSRPGMGRQRVQSAGLLSWFESQHLSGQPTTGFADEQRISLTAVGKSKGEIPSISRDIRRGLSVVASDHLSRIISQLLYVEQIADRDAWLPVLHRLALECSLLLSAAAINKRRNIDPREYVKVKKVPDNSDPSASRVVQGLVFTKNLTHRSMRREIQNARVLLLQGALEYHRQDRLLTIENLLTQEPEYMRMSIQKACRFKPDIILVEKSVARLAQESLLNANISLAINVKSSTLERIAQCSRVQVASHLDDLSQNNIIHCQAFRVEEVPPRRPQRGEAAPKHVAAKHRTLMYIEGTVEGLGCTVLLRGASDAELYRIKRIMRTAVFAAYCARLEVAFFADVCTALSLTVNPMVQRSAAERQAPDAPSRRSNLSGDRSHIEPQSCKPPPLMQGRLAATWEDWGKQIGEACRTSETPVLSVSPYVKKWLVGRTGEDTDSATPANGSSGLGVARTSQDGRGSMVDEMQSGAQAMARVYYDQATQVSYSFRNFKGKLVCQPPGVQKYSHYGRHDQSLVKFLNSCQPSRCEQCGDFSTLHTRQYLHGGQLLAVSFYKGHKGHIDGHDDTVWLWVRVKNRPEVQKQDCGKIKLSTSAQCLSFAHFLELMCSMISLAVEGATLNRDVVLYFKIRHFIVCINPNRIRPFEMVIPSQPVDCEAEAYGRAIQHEAVSLIMEITSMFENLQSQLASLRLLVSSADPKTGKPQSIGSPTRGRSKSVAVVQDVAAAEPSPHLRQAVRLFDLWQERMEGDHAQLREGIRAVSHTVDTTDEVAGHPALQETRFLGIHSLSQQGKRLISLHLKLISLRCSYTQTFHLWSGEFIAFSRALRGHSPAESGGVKAALTSAGVLDANGSAAISPRSPFDEDEGSMLSNGKRVHSSDVEGAVSALLANQHSSARELLDGPINPLRVTITFDVITVYSKESADDGKHQGDGEEYVQVLMHAYEAGEWTAPRANIFSSAFESRANSSTKGGESPPRVDSNNSGAMPVVSLRVGMGPDLSLMASTPAPGEFGGEEDKHEAPEQPQATSPLKAVAIGSKPRPNSATSSKSTPKSPLSVEAAGRSEARLPKPKEANATDSTALTSVSLNSRSSFTNDHPSQEHGVQMTRSSSQVSNTTEASDGTVIVHKEGSESISGFDRVHAKQGPSNSAAPKPVAVQPVQQSTTSTGASRSGRSSADVPRGSHAQLPSGEGSPIVRGLVNREGSAVVDSTGPTSHAIPAGEHSPGQSSPSDRQEQSQSGGEGVGAAVDSSQSVSHAVQMAECSRIGGSSASTNSVGDARRRAGSFSGFPEASGPQGTPIAQYPDVGWMRTAHGADASAAAPQFMAHKHTGPSAVSTSSTAVKQDASGDKTPPSPSTPVQRTALPQHILLSSAFASCGRGSSETGGPSALSALNGQPQPLGESPFATEARQADAHTSSAGLLAHGAPRVSAGTDITQALSSRSSNPMSARPAGSVNGDGQESGSPSLRRSMSTGDGHELREAMIPSLLHCGIKESNIDWFMSRLNKDRAIDRTYTEDRILEGLSGWHTHLAGDEANSSARPNPTRETISPLSSLTAHLPSRNQVLGISASKGRHSSMAGPSFGPTPANSIALLPDGPESNAGPEVAGRGSVVGDVDEAESAAADAPKAAPGATQEAKASTSEAAAKTEAPPVPPGGSKEPIQSGSQPSMTTPFSSVPSLHGRGSQSTLPDAVAGPSHRPHASLPSTVSLPSSHKGIRESVRDGIRDGIQGIHSRAASIVGPPAGTPSGSASISYPDVKFRVLGPGIADMNIPIFIEEPTTAAAFFLTTDEYHEQLARIREDFFASTAPGHSAHQSDHFHGPAHTHTSSRSDAQGATPRSTAGEGGNLMVSSPTQSNVTDLGADGMGAAHLDSASQHDPHSAYHDDSVSATGSIRPPSPAAAEQQSAWSSSEDLRLLRSSVNRSITLEFPANSHTSSPHSDSSMKFTVVAYYAAQFAELRKRVVVGGELAFLLSLSRCKRWKPKGGKTMAYFAKTHDERYVVKSLSRSEKASFLEFAPHYLAHLTNMLETNIPSCLSKVLGFFQITMSNEWKGDIIIMEHVFYEKTLSRSFDLKGTGRNPSRTGTSPNDSSSIMLDDQLKQSTFQRPLIVAPHERSKLMTALKSDTQFLAKVGVMDYSLLLGIDRTNQRLIVGIIDYIRQYTWDKHVENWVKMSGIMPGPKKEPTVISPKQYMKRFYKAMDQYFTITPFANKMSLDQQPDEVPTN